MTDETDAPTRDESTPTERLAGLSRFATDDRSVSEVLGAVLIFGLLVLLLVLVQANAVPAANQQVEFEHSQRVQGDMAELQEALLRASTTGREASVSIETGVVYPNRFFLINPSPASGTIETTAEGTIQFSNLEATSPETDDYFDSTGIEIQSRGISYRPNYNEYRGAPTTVYENGVLYNNYTASRSVVQNRGAILNGRTINLVAINGSLSTASDGSVSVGLTPISTSVRTVSVKARDADTSTPTPIRITVPTRLSVDAWNELLADEPYFIRAEPSSGPNNANAVDILLQPSETYQLRTSAVGVGSGFERTPSAQYMTDIEGDGATVAEGTTHRMVVEVRDQYNNPVSNVEVELSKDPSLTGTAAFEGSDTATPTVVETDADGRAVVEYTTGSITADESGAITVSFGPTPISAEREVTFELDVEQDDGNGPPPDEQGGIGVPINPGDQIVLINSEINQTQGQCNAQNRIPDTCDANLTFQNLNSDTGATIAAARISFYSAQSSGQGSTPPIPDTVRISDADGPPTDFEELNVGGNFTAITPRSTLDTIPQREANQAAPQETYRLRFRKGNQDYGIRQGDFFVLEFIFVTDDGRRTVAYFSAPQ